MKRVRLLPTASVVLPYSLRDAQVASQPLYDTTLHIRPIRVAYFVGEDDRASFERAAALATTQWGGLFNLVVPVRAMGSSPIHAYYRNLLTLFEPDRFVVFAAHDDEGVGSVGHLALRRLTKGRDASCRAVGVEVLSGGQVQNELDFVFVSGQEVVGR
jgi:hypothetical protein